uniref:Uncharacterized protein n=1 Tax=Oryza glumipatula TaxID=40148 RepID=A0A0D9YT93_9ORYZ
MGAFDPSPRKRPSTFASEPCPRRDARFLPEVRTPRRLLAEQPGEEPRCARRCLWTPLPTPIFPFHPCQSWRQRRRSGRRRAEAGKRGGKSGSGAGEVDGDERWEGESGRERERRAAGRRRHGCAPLAAGRRPPYTAAASGVTAAASGVAATTFHGKKRREREREREAATTGDGEIRPRRAGSTASEVAAAASG